ncbi:family 20 glycosylhydrolase [Thalassotalea castellviae]|uniref:beta-N-acetylhexosaminidase n=1 Tax=Thalassotalea castellviae TaxID=3075612 RepID=A0ABU2ZYY8_9GAMM|nr:family 20 glycosylhydrolase [Thalassotalea sp. W431]MDT0603126.1 family 20 glycosylhydrolase [Thalassotalea sp. W431]
MNKKLLSILFSVGVFIIGCEKAPHTPVTSSQSKSDDQVLHKVRQSDLDELAQQLDVSFSLISNAVPEKCDKTKTDGLCFEASITLTPQKTILATDWQIYISQIAPLHNFDSEEFTFTHLNGDLHTITPTEKFKGFIKGESKTIVFRASFWSLAESDIMPNYIISGENLTARVIDSTRAKIDPDTQLEYVPYVNDYTDYQHHFKRTKDDKTPWLDSVGFYQRNSALGDTVLDVSKVIIPTPKVVKYSENNGLLDLSEGINIDFGNTDKSLVIAAIERLAMFGISQHAKGANLKLSIEADKTKMIGSYTADIDSTGITIVGVDNNGVFNGLQSLASLVSLAKKTVPYLHVEDEPLYEFRGLLIDTARNFRSKAFILKLLDQMAAYKLNKLHLHMGEDEGWRLEIPGLPELTQLSSKRCLDLDEQSCLMPQLGAGVDSNSSVNGFYSVADYTEILQAATARHIQVLPSLDMPGHSRAAIKAMAARYTKYSQLEDKEKAEQYLLHDPNDTTKYSSVQFYNDNTINACQESSYRFIKKVMTEVQKIHADAGQPLTRYHIGADETAGAWLESDICKAFIANNDYSVTKMSQLGAYFVERVSNMISDMGIEPAAWSDGLDHTNKENMPAVVQANAWEHLPWGGHMKVNNLANRNWQVVLSIPDVTYFDFPYEADPKEHGYYWASRRTNTEKVFQFMPQNLPAHAEFWLDRQDQPYISDDTVQTDEQGKIIHQPLEQGRSFLGIQGQLWSENVRTDNIAEYKIFPRVIALAERAWHKASWAVPYNYIGYKYSQDSDVFTQAMQTERDKQWQLFANALGQKEFPKLDVADVKYRLPTVGAKIENGLFSANSAFPGLAIEYQEQGKDWQRYIKPVKVNTEVKTRTMTVDQARKGRTVVVKYN